MIESIFHIFALFSAQLILDWGQISVAFLIESGFQRIYVWQVVDQNTFVVWKIAIQQ